MQLGSFTDCGDSHRSYVSAVEALCDTALYVYTPNTHNIRCIHMLRFFVTEIHFGHEIC